MSEYARDPRDIDPRDLDPRDRDYRDRDRDYDYESKEKVPAFNVCVPFQRIIMVQMNLAMRDLLHDFFDELVDDSTEEELVAFRDALEDPAVYVHATKPTEPSFLVCERYMNVVVVEMNDAMKGLIRKFINEIDGGVEDEIWAFNRALQNPEASRKIRQQKRINRQAAEPEAQQGKIRRRRLVTQASYD